MNRKHFINSLGLGTLAAAWPFQKVGAAHSAMPPDFKIPPYLKKGDVIGVTSPAGYTTLEEMKPALKVMESWGYVMKPGSTIGRRDFTFGGTDAERRADLQLMLDDKNIKAIMCARGGYGAIRIVDDLNWDHFKKHPKWIIGFSDITVLHNHIHTQCGVASIHSKMTNSFPDDWAKAEPIQVQTILSIKDALSGKQMQYTATPHAANKQGKGSGPLVGGNLKTLETLSGSASDIDTAGKILFVEDTGEYLYSIDRMFWNLKRMGKLKSLAGLIVGGFKIKADEEGTEFGKTVQDIVLEKIKDQSYPVCFDFPVGHQRANFALKCGVSHTLQVSSTEVSLIENI